MFTPIIRIVLVIISLIAAAYFYSKEDFVNMSMMLIAGGLFIYGYFKYGTVYAAFQQIKKDNVKKAEELISKIKNPDKLTKGHKSYYYFTTGIIALEKKEFEKSHSDLTQALDIGLRTENDKSIVLLNLANVELLREDYNKAIEYIKKVRQLKLKPLVESETNRIEKEIKTLHNNV
ncbi:tetratricopeptide (TPR) repeat protein [Saonia flava]|uniref:Tetratricopeptide (TPR) repeat protein n=1 Tax=Saonia flava TaxID=523696 RepID=A0A846QNG1_9FLAO|nr:tetratricopeptide repeat protein [Saonia flava]NJB69631.1 tetratricopeptide (TPR) repeat protein [Saonia flava]